MSTLTDETVARVMREIEWRLATWVRHGEVNNQIAERIDRFAIGNPPELADAEEHEETLELLASANYEILKLRGMLQTTMLRLAQMRETNTRLLRRLREIAEMKNDEPMSAEYAADALKEGNE